MSARLDRPVVVALLLASLSSHAIAAPPREEKKRHAPVRVTISKETTFITEPLREDGYPDYVAWLNEKRSEGVTPMNNAAVLLWEVLGPRDEFDDWAPAEKKRYFDMLGMAVPEERGDYFRSLADFAAARSLEVAGVELDFGDIETALDEWPAREFPQPHLRVARAWHKENRGHLIALVEASRRAKLYEPLFSEPSDPLMSVPLLGVGNVRSAARGLAHCAVFLALEDKPAEAVERLLAVHRLARLYDGHDMLIHALVAYAIEEMALAEARRLVLSGKLPAAAAARYLRELDKLPPLVGASQPMQYGERLFYLDSVCYIARSGDDLTRIAGAISGDRWELWRRSALQLTKLLVDWNEPLRMGNNFYDRLAKIGRLKGKKRYEALTAIDGAIERKAKKASEFTALDTIKALAAPRKFAGRRLGYLFAGLLLPAATQVYTAEDRTATRQRMTRVVFALAAYRRDQKAFPAKLDDLVPKHLAKLPTDRFQLKPLKYEKTDAGFRLWSAGPNGKDDGGRGFNDEPEGDDVLVKWPPTSEKE